LSACFQENEDKKKKVNKATRRWYKSQFPFPTLPFAATIKSGKYRQLMMNLHHINLVECLRAGGALSHPIANPVDHTLLTEQMTAGSQSRVFEIVATYGTKSISLKEES
jgi:hypothetical protein